jgi:peptide/nickel transport system permease protein
MLMHVTDWFIALPALPLAIALAAVLGQGATSITIAIALTSWTGTARLVRAQVLAVEGRPFIERARALGATDVQLVTRHVLPNVMPLILVSSTLTVASAILAEATLTFLGLGDPTSVSWGSMLNTAFMQGAVTAGAWWYLIPPGVAILVIVLGFTLVGRAVEHVLNVRVQPR